MAAIDFCTDHRLTDTLALQTFILRHHLMRRALFLGVCMLVGLTLATVMNGAPLVDALDDLSRNAGMYGTLFLVGLALILALTYGLGIAAWIRRPKPRQIRAAITAEGISMQKDGFSYSTRWADADLVTENRAAFLLKFRQLYIRLPRRGFSPAQEAAFRALARAAAPAAVNRLGS